jgi:mersacidin/lichenicidin family type 2 lantibiotic
MPVMTDERTVRAWRDPIYRASLSEGERALVPALPVGDSPAPREVLTRPFAGTDCETCVSSCTDPGHFCCF